MLRISLVLAIIIGLFGFALNQNKITLFQNHVPVLDSIVPEQHDHQHHHDHHHDHSAHADHFCGGDEVNRIFYENHPQLKGLQDQLEDTWARRVAEGHSFNASRTVYTLPVVVHVIQNNGVGNMPDAQAQAAIQNLNEAFANTGPYNPLTGVATDIQFCLAQQDPAGNPTTGITNTSSTLTVMDKNTQDASLKSLIQWDPNNYINIWVVNEIIGGVAGYAYFPSAHGTAIDGIVIEEDFMSSNSADASVLVHEMGHYLGLYHTFEGGCTNNNCTTDGDKVCDTPPDNTTARPPCGSPMNSCTTDEDDPSTNNPFRAVALGGLGDQVDQKENYMDYSNLACYDRFSSGQKDRMHFFLLGIRSSLLNSPGCGVACTLPINIYVTPSATSVTTGTSVWFQNNSTNGATYNWSIGGTTFATTKSTNYVFNTVGTFWVVLEVSNANSPNCTKLDSFMIQVFCSPPCSEVCDNGIDDDGNGWIDCYDTACACNDCSGKEANTWYFGRGTGLDFNSGTPVAIEGQINGSYLEACASVSDQNGNILFYTDGKKVWNRMHAQMPSGNIGGHTSTAQILILPKPGDPLIYYIFVPDVQDSTKGLTYNVVDMAQNNNLGDVVQHNVPLSGVKTTEAVTAAKNCNNTDYWVISKEYNSNRYHVYDVTASGVNSTPFIQAVGSVHATIFPGNSNAISNIKVSPDGRRMATSFREDNKYEVYDFDNATGVISNPITMQDASWGSCYGVEFSPDSKVLYASSIYPWSIYQFDLTVGTTGAALKATEYEVTSTTNYGGNIELGPDGKIYRPRSSVRALDVIHHPNNLGASCNYQQEAISTWPDECGIGISNNIKNYVVPIATSIDGNAIICSTTGATVEMYGLSDIPCNLDTVIWTHSGTNSMTWVNYSNVQLNADYTGTDTLIADFIGPCEHISDTIIIKSTINPAIDFGPDQMICTNGVHYLLAGAGYQSYLWQDGSVDSFYTVSEDGTYWVEATTYCGTVIRDTIVITIDNSSYINLQDTLINQGDSAMYNFNPSYTYNWWPNQNIDCATCPNPSFYPTTTTMYYVSVDNGQGCIATDSILIMVNPTSTTSIAIQNAIKVYPNPAQTFVKIESTQAAIDLIRVYDASGRLIESKQLTKAERVELSTEKYPNGLILIEVLGDNFLYSEKVLIQR